MITRDRRSEWVRVRLVLDLPRKYSPHSLYEKRCFQNQQRINSDKFELNTL